MYSPRVTALLLVTLALPTCDRDIVVGVEMDSGADGTAGESGEPGGVANNAGGSTSGEPVCGDRIPEGPTEQCDDGGGTLTCTVTCQFRARVTDGMILLYTFEESSGDRIFDRSGFEAPLNLTIPDVSAVTWKPGSLVLDAPVLIASDMPASKLASAVKGTNEFSVEAWVRPANVEQDGPSRILTVSNAGYERNFMLAQNKAVAAGRARTTTTDENGYPELESTPTLMPSLVHLVFTHAVDGTERIFIDAAVSGQRVASGDLSNWNETFRLAVGAEFNEELTSRDFLGEVFLLAVYARALSAAEVEKNFLDGP